MKTIVLCGKALLVTATAGIILIVVTALFMTLKDIAA